MLKSLAIGISYRNDSPPKAFLMHESCWFLLVQHFEGEDIDLDRLFAVSREIPHLGRGDTCE